jgi:hypothetical protein
MPGPHSVADTPARAVTILDGSTGRLAPYRYCRVVPDGSRRNANVEDTGRLAPCR